MYRHGFLSDDLHSAAKLFVSGSRGLQASTGKFQKIIDQEIANGQSA
jgi:hypothetical protein